MAKIGGRTVGPTLNQAKGQELFLLREAQRNNPAKMHGRAYLSPVQLVDLARKKRRLSNTHPHKRSRS